MRRYWNGKHCVLQSIDWGRVYCRASKTYIQRHNMKHKKMGQMVEKNAHQSKWHRNVHPLMRYFQLLPFKLKSHYLHRRNCWKIPMSVKWIAVYLKGTKNLEEKATANIFTVILNISLDAYQLKLQLNTNPEQENCLRRLSTLESALEIRLHIKRMHERITWNSTVE